MLRLLEFSLNIFKSKTNEVDGKRLVGCHEEDKASKLGNIL